MMSAMELRSHGVVFGLRGLTDGREPRRDAGQTARSLPADFAAWRRLTDDAADSP